MPKRKQENPHHIDQSKSAKITHNISLGLDATRNILLFITDILTLHACSLVNKEWNQAFQYEKIWKLQYIRHFAQLMSEITLNYHDEVIEQDDEDNKDKEEEVAIEHRQDRLLAQLEDPQEERRFLASYCCGLTWMQSFRISYKLHSRLRSNFVLPFNSMISVVFQLSKSFRTDISWTPQAMLILIDAVEEFLERYVAKSIHRGEVACQSEKELTVFTSIDSPTNDENNIIFNDSNDSDSDWCADSSSSDSDASEQSSDEEEEASEIDLPIDWFCFIENLFYDGIDTMDLEEDAREWWDIFKNREASMLDKFTAVVIEDRVIFGKKTLSELFQRLEYKKACGYEGQTLHIPFTYLAGIASNSGTMIELEKLIQFLMKEHNKTMHEPDRLGMTPAMLGLASYYLHSGDLSERLWDWSSLVPDDSLMRVLDWDGAMQQTDHRGWNVLDYNPYILEFVEQSKVLQLPFEQRMQILARVLAGGCPPDDSPLDPKCVMSKLINLQDKEEVREAMSRRHEAFGGASLLHLLLATHQPDLQMIEKLLELGASAEAKDDDGRTPLMEAIEAQNVDAVRLLVARGAAAVRIVLSAEICECSLELPCLEKPIEHLDEAESKTHAKAEDLTPNWRSDCIIS